MNFSPATAGAHPTPFAALALARVVKAHVTRVRAAQCLRMFSVPKALPERERYQILCKKKEKENIQRNRAHKTHMCFLAVL